MSRGGGRNGMRRAIRVGIVQPLVNDQCGGETLLSHHWRRAATGAREARVQLAIRVLKLLGDLCDHLAQGKSRLPRASGRVSQRCRKTASQEIPPPSQRSTSCNGHMQCRQSGGLLFHAQPLVGLAVDLHYDSSHQSVCMQTQSRSKQKRAPFTQATASEAIPHGTHFGAHPPLLVPLL